MATGAGPQGDVGASIAEVMWCLLLSLYVIIFLVSIGGAMLTWSWVRWSLKGGRFTVSVYLLLWALFALLRSGQWAINLSNARKVVSSVTDELWTNVLNGCAVVLFFVLKMGLTFVWAFVVLMNLRRFAYVKLKWTLCSIFVLCFVSLVIPLFVFVSRQQNALSAQNFAAANSNNNIFNLIVACWALVISVAFIIFGFALSALSDIQHFRQGLLLSVVIVSFLSFALRSIINFLYAYDNHFFDWYQQHYASSEFVEYLLVELIPSLLIVIGVVSRTRAMRPSTPRLEGGSFGPLDAPLVSIS